MWVVWAVFCAVVLADSSPRVIEVELDPRAHSFSLPSGTRIFPPPSSSSPSSPNYNNIVYLGILTYDDNTLASLISSFSSSKGEKIGDIVSTSDNAITFQPPEESCYVECVVFYVQPLALGPVCPTSRGKGREVTCNCNSSFVTYVYQGKVCEPVGGTGFLAPVIIYFFIAFFVADNVCRSHIRDMRGQIYVLVAFICVLRIVQNIFRLPTTPALSDEAKTCLIVIPHLLQFLILRLMLAPKHRCGKWFFTLLILVFVGVCAILFAAIKKGSGSQMILIVNLILCGLELLFAFISLCLTCTCSNVLQNIFPDNQRARVWVMIAMLVIMAIQSGCLAAGFSSDARLLSSTVGLLFFDVVFLELGLFYYYHFDVARKIAPTAIEMEQQIQEPQTA